MMKNAGLVSVTFRGLTPEQIVPLMKKTDLRAVEWGADVHCMPGKTERVKEIRTLCEENGIRVTAYGSYYRVGTHEENAPCFEDIVTTAAVLGAPVIRVWAYNKGSADVSADEYAAVVADMKRICALAAKENITVTLECHNRTLTDEYHAALKLLCDADCPNLAMYWQPNQFRTVEYNKEAAEALKDYVTNVHVFNWRENDKMPLGEAVTLWKEYKAILDGGKRAHDYLLEFMPNGTPEELDAEAAALMKILEN